MVEDLLQDPSSSYRYLMSSAVTGRENFRQRSLSAFPALSTSCPSVSDVGLGSPLSSSMPLYSSSKSFTRHGTGKPSSPLRSLVKRQRYSSLNVVNTIAEGDDAEEQTPEPTQKGGEGGESALVQIVVDLIDPKDEEFDAQESVRLSGGIRDILWDKISFRGSGKNWREHSFLVLFT